MQGIPLKQGFWINRWLLSGWNKINLQNYFSIVWGSFKTQLFLDRVGLNHSVKALFQIYEHWLTNTLRNRSLISSTWSEESKFSEGWSLSKSLFLVMILILILSRKEQTKSCNILCFRKFRFHIRRELSWHPSYEMEDYYRDCS